MGSPWALEQGKMARCTRLMTHDFIMYLPNNTPWPFPCITLPHFPYPIPPPLTSVRLMVAPSCRDAEVLSLAYP